MAKALEINRIDCAADALESAVKILIIRFKEIVNLREAALDFSDIEGVHDMRVAVRRLRSALRDFAPLFDKRSLKNVIKDIKHIADTLGGVRDQDVAIKMLEEFSAKIESESVKKGLGVLLEKREKLRDKARLNLIKTITVENISDLESRFSEVIENSIARKKTVNQSNFGDFGNEIIKNGWQDLQDLGASLYSPFNVEKLHKMRIAAKRLRYAIELFAASDDENLTFFANEIAEMQSFLGDVHDCDIWIEDLHENLKSQHKKQSTETENYQAAVQLLSDFTNKRTKKYRSALELWSNWKGNYFAQRLKAAFS